MREHRTQKHSDTTKRGDRWQQVDEYETHDGGTLLIRTDVTDRKNIEEKIQKSLAEKEVLLQEIHHRVKNNFQVISSLLSLQAAKYENEQVVEALEDSRQRVMAMARVHEHLYSSEDLASINAKDYLTSVVAGLNLTGNLDLKSPLWSLGHRNVQGLAWDPATGQMYASEHGPSGEVGFGAYDEINRIVKGGNYGWPLMVGAPKRRGYRDPLVAWPRVATPPSGMAFWRGDLYVATLGSEALVRISLKDGRATRIERWFNDGEVSRYGRLRDAVLGPDGALYVLTGNRDFRGSPRRGDDRILRITGH